MKSGTWESRIVYRAPLVAMLPCGHRQAASRRVVLASLSEDDFVLPADTGQVSLGERCLAACRQAGFEPRVTRRIDGPRSGFIAAVATGAGVSVLPDSLRVIRLAGGSSIGLSNRRCRALTTRWYGTTRRRGRRDRSEASPEYGQPKSDRASPTGLRLGGRPGRCVADAGRFQFFDFESSSV